MSASGRASDFMQAWGEGHGKPHNPGHKAWGADDCDACTAEAFDPWEALVHAARIAGFLRDEQADATAPPCAPTASVSDQGADPRTPGTDGAQIAAEPVSRRGSCRRWTTTSSGPRHGCGDCSTRSRPMTDRSMFDEDYDPADVVLPRMSRNRRVIGRLPIDHTEPSAECAACGDLWLKAAQEALRRAERAEAKIARVRALCDEYDGAVWLPFVDITGQRHGATVRTDQVRAALDGTEPTP